MNMRPLCRVALCLAAAVSLSGFGAGLRADTRPIRFDHISLQQGLSQSTVLCIFQDSKGFIWIGTEDGLNRFDGHNFNVYKNDPSDSSSLGHDGVWSIDEDADGNLWVGTSGGGAAMWNRSNDRFVRFEATPDDEGLSSQYVRTIHVDSSGMVWIGTRDNGLDRLDPRDGEVKHFRADPQDPSSLGDDRIFALGNDRSGNLWIGTDDGLNRFDPATGEFTVYRSDPADPSSLSDGRVRAVFEGARGELWVGTYGGGLNRLDRSTGAFTRFRHDPEDPSSLSHDRVRAIWIDDVGRLWVGTSGGLDLFDGSGFTHYTHDAANPTSLGGDHVMALLQDRGGVLWVGTRTAGISKWNPRSWQFGHHGPDPSNPVGLNNGNVLALAEDRAGRLWVGTFGGGLNVLDRVTGRFTQYRHDRDDPESLGSDRITTLQHDHRGTLWIGTLDGGLSRFDPATENFTVYRHDPDRPGSLSGDGIMGLLEDSRGRLWIGTFGGGLDRLDPGGTEFVHYVHDPSNGSSLSGNRVTSIVEDTRGFLWVGTDGAGLNRLDPRTGSSMRYRHDPSDPASLSTDAVFSLYLDGADTLWVGTRGGGLDRLARASQTGDTVSFKNYSERDGLPNEVIYGILADASGDLWMSTNRGLSRFDLHNETFNNYDTSDGLQSDEFHFGSAFRSTSGELFFGGVNGFNAFFPERLRHNTNVPPVVLTGFLNANQPVTDQGPPSEIETIDLGYRDDVVSFEFAALDFSSPDSNRYAYKLDGFDKDWIDLGNIHRVTYTDLDAGNYVFRIRASNNDGVWNENGLSIDIAVAAPPWQTPWAYALYLLIAVGIIMRILQIQRRKRQREAEYTRRLECDVKARTEELAERATELETLNQKLIKASITDSLTGLANRRFLLQYLDKEVSLIKRRYSKLTAGELEADSFDLMFMMVDLDNFKTINDTCGHAAGDRVLQDLRDILQDSCRESDIIIRWGGDELLIVGRDSKPEGLESLAERLRSRIEQHVFELDDGQVVRTTCSIGFSSYPFVHAQVDLLSWEQVVSVADRALYVAKRTGRNAWVGFISTEATPSKGLLAAVRDEPGRLMDEGGLDVRTSIRDKDLVWECPDSAHDRTLAVLQSEEGVADLAKTMDRDQPVS